jgi:hypothetical protein
VRSGAHAQRKVQCFDKLSMVGYWIGLVAPEFKDQTSAMARPPKKCIFCGANANSQEHFWPTWLHDLLRPAPQGARHGRELHSYHPNTGSRVTGPRDRQGDQRTIRIRAVCQACNNGWMNRIEGEVRPYLTPIITGELTTLDRQGLTTLAKWMALKVIVAEHAAPDNALTPQCDRTAFWPRGVIPSYFRLYVAHNVSNAQLYYLRHAHCIAYSPDGPNPPLDGTSKNVQIVTFATGEAVMQAVSTRIEGAILEDRAYVVGFHDRCRIWPVPATTIDFPQRPRLDADGIENIASILERYISASSATWLG